MYAFGASDNFSATGLSQAHVGEISAEVTKNILKVFKDYPLSERNISTIHSRYISKLKAVMNIQTKVKKKSSSRPIVEVTAITVNSNFAKLASRNENLYALGFEMRQLQKEGATVSTLKNNSQFQNQAFQAITHFIDNLPLNNSKTIEVVCKIVEGKDGNFYYAPENPEVLKNFLTTNFVIDANDGQEEMDQFFGFVLAPNTPEEENSETYGKDDTWTIYWYICGTDLESDDRFQSATNDIKEMEQVKLSKNVRVLIQTGTTSKWHHEEIAKYGNGRYLYDSKGLRRISKSNSNMYEAKTLVSFLEYGEKNYPADHRILIFWDHGGVSGVCTDKENTYNSLSLNDIRSALEEVYGKSPNKVPFEVIGFDACLMGSYECAKSTEGFAQYMVASEAPENQYGWYYTDWLNELSAHPESNGAILGQKICSGSMEDCRRHSNITKKDFVSESTFSVVDISKLDRLHVAHKNFFTVALNHSRESHYFALKFNNNVNNNPIPNYSEAYIDLRSLAEHSKKLMPDTSNALVMAIDEVVVGKPIKAEESLHIILIIQMHILNTKLKTVLYRNKKIFMIFFLE